MTLPREWPNNSKEARDRSAEEAAKALRIVSPLLTEQMTREQEVIRIAIVINCLQTILRFLEREGAQTKPN
jgi:hypothetical protein